MLRLKKNGTKIDHQRAISLIYDHLPEQYFDVFKKWYNYQNYIFGSPVFLKKALFYTFIIPLIIIGLSLNPVSVTIALFIIVFSKCFISFNVYQQQNKSRKKLFSDFIKFLI